MISHEMTSDVFKLLVLGVTYFRCKILFMQKIMTSMAESFGVRVVVLQRLVF
jgi:hypothetical protein